MTPERLTPERRFTSSTIEYRSSAGQPPVLRGHAAVFNSTADIGPFKEIIEPGAFTRTLKDDAGDIVALFNHDPSMPLARMGYGLTLREDTTGLACEIEPDTQTSVGRDVVQYVANKSVRGMSIGFLIPPGGQRLEYRNGVEFRIISSVRLFDVSPVTYPAYKATDIALRSSEGVLAELKKQPDWKINIDLRRRVLALNS